MKRQGENRQLRPEEVEALENNGGDDGSGTFQRASKETLARRKIVKVSRRFVPNPAPTVAPEAGTTGMGGVACSSGSSSSSSDSRSDNGNSSSSGSASSDNRNPFAGFQGLTTPNLAAPSAPSNPFAGFQGLTTPNLAAPSAPSNPFAGFQGLTTGTKSPDILATAKPSPAADVPAKEEGKEKGGGEVAKETTPTQEDARSKVQAASNGGEDQTSIEVTKITDAKNGKMTEEIDQSSAGEAVVVAATSEHTEATTNGEDGESPQKEVETGVPEKAKCTSASS